MLNVGVYEPELSHFIINSYSFLFNLELYLWWLEKLLRPTLTPSRVPPPSKSVSCLSSLRAEASRLKPKLRKKWLPQPANRILSVRMHITIGGRACSTSILPFNMCTTRSTRNSGKTSLTWSCRSSKRRLWWTRTSSPRTFAWNSPCVKRARWPSWRSWSSSFSKSFRHLSSRKCLKISRLKNESNLATTMSSSSCAVSASWSKKSSSTLAPAKR